MVFPKIYHLQNRSSDPHIAHLPPQPQLGESLLLLVEQSWSWLIAGLGHDLHGLVVEGGLPHLVVHEFILAEHAQLHLRLHAHALWDTKTP